MPCAPLCLARRVLQDIGESETHELEGLYKPLLGGLLEAVLARADLSSQGGQLEGLDLKQLVSSEHCMRGGCRAHSTPACRLLLLVDE